jgi:predicted AlkP superfamily phosphohydrolase/phosphomutase
VVKEPLARLTLIWGVLLLVVIAGCGTHPPKSTRKVIVLGIDGMDPVFVERHWNDLPSLRSLRDRGSFRRLGTTMPPQSPVAWSSFITGLDPAAHGIFDFVHRDPSNLQPFSSMGKTEEPRFSLPVGPYLLPLSHSHVISLRKGTAFWQILSERGVPVSIMRMPTNYPPLEFGRALSGMGTPDLRGTLGTFSFYTDDPEELTRSVSGGRIIKIQHAGSRVVLPIEGPPNGLRKDQRFSTVDLIVDVDPEQPFARLAIGDEMAIVREGEWSGWLPADFPLIPHLVSSRGMFRVFARQLHPRFELYVSPINVDPVSPVLPVSAPASFGRDIAEETGRYYTLGIPEDTSALRQNVFNLHEFLIQSRLVVDDEQRLFRYALRHFESGLLFFYFSSVDENSHVLWDKHDAELLSFYKAADASVGEARRSFPAADLIVMSDHGFTTFDRAVHLNAWLYQQGLLALQGSPGNETSLADIDWSHTKAYALGLNGLYINLAGREKHGIVQPGPQCEALIANLRKQLLALRDPANGRAVVETISDAKPAAPNASVAPDLIVGYGRGYRGSWQTALGGTPDAVIEDNTDAWIADHCINPADVPGVLFTNRPDRLSDPALQDVTVSVLDLFGIQPGSGMRGHSTYRAINAF